MAIAIKRFRDKQAAPAGTLAEIAADHLPELPADPFTGETTHHKLLPKGYRLHRVGSGRVDNGGSIERDKNGLLLHGGVTFTVTRRRQTKTSRPSGRTAGEERPP